MREQRFATVNRWQNMCSRVFAENNVTIWACVTGKPNNQTNVTTNQTNFKNQTNFNLSANTFFRPTNVSDWPTNVSDWPANVSDWPTNVSGGWTETNRTNSSVQQNRTRPSLLRKSDKYVRSELYNYLHAFWVVCVFLLLTCYLRHKRWTRRKCRVQHLDVPRQYRTRSTPRQYRTRSASVP